MSQRGGPPKPKKKAAPFYAPFQALKELQQKKPAGPPAKAPPARAPAPARRAPEEDEATLFLSAMDGVRQLTDRGEPPPSSPPRLPPQVLDENAEALAQLAELVAGQGAFDIADSDEFIEGSAPGTDPSLLRALRQGTFSVQGQLDLHGMTQTEARDAVERFLTESRRAGKRCVLVVHGRGLHSKDQVPVLKERLRGWLSQRRVGKQVLAFASARPHDGGAGAVYVLLRR